MAPWPKLVLDSGASIHCVGDPKLLSNLRDALAGMRVRVANGDTLSITKIGDIQMIDAGFTIPDVYLAPGLKSDLISVNQLARQTRIHTWFDGDRAKLYVGRELVGVAVAPRDRKYGQYILESLSMPKSGLDGEMRSVPVSSGGSSAPTGLGSVLCWLKALLCERLFSAGPEEKPMQRRERRRKKRKNSGRRR